jgi:hypothetical protein
LQALDLVAHATRLFEFEVAGRLPHPLVEIDGRGELAVVESAS